MGQHGVRVRTASRLLLAGLLLGGCAPEGRQLLGVLTADLAAASLVLVDAGGRAHVTTLALEGGALPGVLHRTTDLPGELFLVTVSRDALQAASTLVDLARSGEALIRPASRATCAEEGEVLDGRVTLSLRGRAVAYALPDGAEAAVSILDPDAPSLGWLAGLQLDAPALRSPSCEGAPDLVLRRLFEEDAVFPQNATLAGAPTPSTNDEMIDLAVLSDGRLLVLGAYALYLRHPSEPYRDDPRMVRRIRHNRPDGARGRGAMLVIADEPDGRGEVWVVVTSSTAERWLEAVGFDAQGLSSSRRLSRINPPELEEPGEASPGDLTRLHRVEDGRLVAVTAGGDGLLAPGPEGPWTRVALGRGFARVLEPLPEPPLSFFVTAGFEGHLWSPLMVPPGLQPLGSPPTGGSILGGAVERLVDRGGFRVLVSGEWGLLASRAGAAPSEPWSEQRVFLPVSEGPRRGCEGPTVCGRSALSVRIWDAQPFELAEERWLLLGLDACPELLVMRRRDGCAFFAELEGGVAAELAGRSSRRIVHRRGRWFRLGNAGAVRELVLR